MGTDRHRLWMTAAVAVVVALVVFAVTFTSNTFLARSDCILRLPLLSHGKHVPRIFSQHFMAFTGGRYRPLPYALLALTRTFIPADNVVFWHVWLLAFHVLNALLVYAVARHFTDREGPAVLALGVFLLHPLASVFGHQIDLFPDILGGSFYLGTFLCYLHWVRRRRPSTYVLSLVLFVGGLLSSHALLTLPLLILLYELLYERTGAVKSIARVLPYAACALLIGYCFLTFHPHLTYYEYPPDVPAGPLRYWTYSFTVGGANSLLALARGWALRVPVKAVVRGMYSTWNLLALALLLLALLTAAAAQMLKKRWWAVGLFLIFVSVLPRCPSTRNLAADYTCWSYRYLPLAGFALLAGAVTTRLLEISKRPLRHVVTVGAALLVLVYGALLVVANLHMRTPKSYWSYVLRKNPNSEAARIHLGEMCLAEGKEAEARKHLFASTLRDMRESCLAMGRYYMDRKEPLAAAIHLRIAKRDVRFGLRFQEYPLVLAEVLMAAGALDFAEQQLGDVVSANPHNTTGIKRLADILARKGYLPAAVGYLEAVVDIDPADADGAERLAVLRKSLYYPESLPAPGKVTPPGRAWLSYIMREPVAAEKTLVDDVIALADRRVEDPIIQVVASIRLSERKQHDRASRAVDRTMAMLPAYPFARTTKAYVEFNAGKAAQALAILDNTEDVTPRDARSLLFFASSRLQAKQYPIAIASTRAALRGNPNKPQTHGVLATLLVRRGEFREALFHYRRALDQPREKLGHVHNGLGYVLMRLGELDKAIVHYRESIAIDPKQPRVYRNLTTALMGKRHFEEAIRALEEALKAIPDEVALQCDLALLLAAAPRAELRSGEEAVRLAQAASRKTDPMTAEILDVLAAAYAETGRFDTAVETARQAARLARLKRNRKLAQSIEQRIRLYQDHRPFRLSPRTDRPSPDK